LIWADNALLPTGPYRDPIDGLALNHETVAGDRTLDLAGRIVVPFWRGPRQAIAVVR